MEDYRNFIQKYYFNRDVIKEFSFKVIKKFMNIFKKKIKNKINDCNYIFNEIQKFNENNIIENIEKEYLNLIYFKFLGEKEDNNELSKQFYLKLFSITLNNYNIKRIFLNFTIFKKNFNMIIKELYKCYDNKKNFIEIFYNEIKNIENNKKNILLYLFYCVYFSISQSNNFLIDANYIDIIFTVQNILRENLNFELINIKLIICSVENCFIHIFNKHFYLLKKININQFGKIKEYFIKKLLEKEPSFYEKYVYIINEIILNNNKDSSQLIKIIINIMTTNNRLLHKIGLNLLNKNLENKIINNNFLKKYIIIYDSLDSFSYFYFKTMLENLKFIIEYINNN